MKSVKRKNRLDYHQVEEGDRVRLIVREDQDNSEWDDYIEITVVDGKLELRSSEGSLIVRPCVSNKVLVEADLPDYSKSLDFFLERTNKSYNEIQKIIKRLALWLEWRDTK